MSIFKTVKKLLVTAVVLCFAVSLLSVTTFAASKPSQPSFTSVKASNGEVTLKWKEISGADGYQIKYSYSKNGAYETLTTVSKGNKVKYTSKQLNSGTVYFKIRAFDKTDSGKVYSSYSAVKSVKIQYEPLWTGKWVLDAISTSYLDTFYEETGLAKDELMTIEFHDDKTTAKIIMRYPDNINIEEMNLILMPIAGTSDQFYLIEEGSDILNFFKSGDGNTLLCIDSVISNELEITNIMIYIRP